MCNRWTIGLLCMLASSIIASVSAGAEKEVNMGGAPELGVAVIVDGHEVEIRRFVKHMVTQTTSNLPTGVKWDSKRGSMGPASTTEVVPLLEIHFTRIDASKVSARHVDGSVISSQMLMNELAKPIPVVLATQGQQFDPVFSKLLKPESLILLLPSTPPPIVYSEK